MTPQQNLQLEVPTVSELTDQIKQLLEANFADVSVEGELSNVKKSRNGHLYFTIKDDKAQLPCVMWRSRASQLEKDLVDGQHVILGGQVQVYPPHGRYQLIVSYVQQAGVGKLQQAFEELKQKLKKEGLFDEEHKKPLPSFPMRIGVVTSSAGAAFQDIRSTLERRWPLARLKLWHASVQGEFAAPELVEGIQYFSREKNVDLLIVGRGGGSLEDLWPFNEEAVARAVFDCKVPVISAVGHETDFSISDFVADMRAATPTQAAELATPDIQDIRFLVDDMESKTIQSVQNLVNRYRETVQRLGKSHALLVVKNRIQSYSDRVHSLREFMLNRFRHMASQQREFLNQFHFQSSRFLARKASLGREGLNELRHKLEVRSEKLIARNRERLTELHHQVEKQNPNAPLEKGYVRVWQNRKWVKALKEFQEKETAELEWKDGRVRR